MLILNIKFIFKFFLGLPININILFIFFINCRRRKIREKLQNNNNLTVILNYNL